MGSHIPLIPILISSTLTNSHERFDCADRFNGVCQCPVSRLCWVWLCWISICSPRIFSIWLCFAAPHQAKHEVRDHAGNVAGSYSYVDAEGKLVKATYTAGVDGFKIHSNNLPVAPVADLELPVAPVYTGVAPVDTGVAPEPVQDTPEVAAAKAAHLELLAAAGSRKKRSLPHGFPYAGYPYAYGHLGYAHHGYARLGYAPYGYARAHLW